MMNNHTFLPGQMDYKDSINIKCTAKEAFESLTLYIDKWWTDEFAGSADQVNNIFKVSFDSTFMEWIVEELDPGKKIVWKCIDANTDVPGLVDKKEWIGTSVIWKISSQNGVSTISMRHVGLTPDFECFEICEKGWNSYFINSLQRFLVTGEGIPYSAQR